MMDNELPVKKPELVLRKLDSLSVDGLNDDIAELEAEILRTRLEIEKRGSARAKADSFFKPERRI
jgi:uncharacterized small protein (DUF1192 family)